MYTISTYVQCYMFHLAMCTYVLNAYTMKYVSFSLHLLQEIIVVFGRQWSVSSSLIVVSTHDLYILFILYSVYTMLYIRSVHTVHMVHTDSDAGI